MRLKQNGLMWFLVAVIVVGGAVANMYYGQVDVAYRAIAGIFVAAIVLWIIYLTSQGQRAWSFIKSSRREMAKVVWPSRQEIVQTSIVVIVVVFITALVLWGFDFLFAWFVKTVVGVKG